MEKKVYELTVGMEPKASQKEIKAVLDEILKKSGGKIIATDFWGKTELQYPIAKLNSLAYCLFEIEATGAQVADIEKRLVLEDKVLRSLLVKKNFKVKPAPKVSVDDEEAEVVKNK